MKARLKENGRIGGGKEKRILSSRRHSFGEVCQHDKGAEKGGVIVKLTG